MANDTAKRLIEGAYKFAGVADHPAHRIVTKGKRLRRVPVHKHLLDQKFIMYVEQRREAGKPLFYDYPTRARGGKGANPQWQKVAERLAEWVHGSLKVHGVQPNHGWRHLWREIVRGTRMKAELCDYMSGHEGKSGTKRPTRQPAVARPRKQMEFFPRFKVPALNRSPTAHNGFGAPECSSPRRDGQDRSAGGAGESGLGPMARPRL